MYSLFDEVGSAQFYGTRRAFLLATLKVHTHSFILFDMLRSSLLLRPASRPLWQCMRPTPLAVAVVTLRLLHTARKDLDTRRLRPTGVPGVSMNDLRKQKLQEIAAKPAISLGEFRALVAEGPKAEQLRMTLVCCYIMHK